MTTWSVVCFWDFFFLLLLHPSAFSHLLRIIWRCVMFSLCSNKTQHTDAASAPTHWKKKKPWRRPLLGVYMFDWSFFIVASFLVKGFWSSAIYLFIYFFGVASTHRKQYWSLLPPSPVSTLPRKIMFHMHQVFQSGALTPLLIITSDCSKRPIGGVAGPYLRCRILKCLQLLFSSGVVDLFWHVI